MSEARFLLDSNICIYLLGALSETSRRKVESYAPGEVVTSAVAYAEVVRGLDKFDASAVAKAEAFFDTIPVLAFDSRAARFYRHLPFERHRFDHLIAAHALSLGLVLVTHNTRHFRTISGLRMDDWTEQ